MEVPQFHVPVLVREVVKYLVTNKAGVYVDCTLGGGGHSLAILETLDKNGKLIGIDADNEALSYARNRLIKFREQIVFKHINFAQLNEVVHDAVDGILFDLGVSSHQIDERTRGFSYQADGPLDMRMNLHGKLTAAQIINEYDEQELVRVFKKYGEERFARSIAREIVLERGKNYISNTKQLTKIILKKVPFRYRVKSLSRIFQALRIEVNQELENLICALNQSIPLLKKGGRLVVISYHSLEDRIVKQFFKSQENPCTCPPNIPECVCNKKPLLKIITKQPITPTLAEISSNPRSRSARLRVAERI